MSIVLSCIQPTAELHIGNYFGAIQNWVALQEEHECIFGVVDLHAMTVPFDPEALRANTVRMYGDLIACGLSPEKSILFVQSLVPEHTEIFWILNCLCPFGELRRMTQFKEKSTALASGANDVSAALFSYPVLQAADILAYRAELVPVGEDQVQHLELSRELARRFNARFATDYLKEPRPLLTATPRVMSPADPLRKMSKSLGSQHYIGLFDDESTIRAKLRTAVTDSGSSSDQMSPGVKNLFDLLKACRDVDTHAMLTADYAAGHLKYSHLKEKVGDALTTLTATFRERRSALPSPALLYETIRATSARARERARETAERLRELVGLPSPA
jgi:tryptophanyl-tRNA synthetase